MLHTKLLPSKRHELILKSIQETGSVTILGMAKACGVSEMTLRRDLDELDKQNLLSRTHGGATSIDQLDGLSIDLVEPNINNRTTQNREAKLAIAQCAVNIIDSSQTIALDVGSTTFELAVLLQNMPLRVFTNSLRIASRLGQSRPSVYVPGGQIGGVEPAIIGAQAIGLLNNFNFDIAFIGAAGLKNDALFDYSPEDSEIKRALINRAEMVVVLLDCSKFERPSVVKFSELSDIDMLITDSTPPESLKEALRKSDVAIEIAKPKYQIGNAKRLSAF